MTGVHLDGLRVRVRLDITVIHVELLRIPGLNHVPLVLMLIFKLNLEDHRLN